MNNTCLRPLVVEAEVSEVDSEEVTEVDTEVDTEEDTEVVSEEDTEEDTEVDSEEDTGVLAPVVVSAVDTVDSVREVADSEEATVEPA